MEAAREVGGDLCVGTVAFGAPKVGHTFGALGGITAKRAFVLAAIWGLLEEFARLYQFMFFFTLAIILTTVEVFIFAAVIAAYPAHLGVGEPLNVVGLVAFNAVDVLDIWAGEKSVSNAAGKLARFSPRNWLLDPSLFLRGRRRDIVGLVLFLLFGGGHM